MKIIACVKHVPDTAATIKVSESSSYEDNGIKFVMNPYDEYGIEEAVRLVEENGGEVVIVTVGKEEAASTIRGALAMGAHRAILVKTEGQFLDSTLTAKALKAAIEQDGLPDMIFTGKSSVDTEGFQTQYRLSKLLGIPVVNEVSSLTIHGDRAVVHRDADSGGKQVIEMPTPCVIGATKGLNQPRYPKLPHIMKAKKKEIKRIEIKSLGVDEVSGRISIELLEKVPERSGATMLEGSIETQVADLLNILKEEEKVL